MKSEIISSGDVESDFFAMLCEKSNGNISGVLKLMGQMPLSKIEKVYEFWVEITLPMEEREKRMRAKADKAAQEAANTLFHSIQDAKIKTDSGEGDSSESLQRFLDIYKRKP